jgi:protein O-GlcNAc transferase
MQLGTQNSDRSRAKPTELRTPTGPLRFSTGPDGKSQLVVTTAVPDGLAEAYTEASQGQHERARQRLAALERTNLGPRSPDGQVAFLMGQTYFLVKDWAAAERWFQRVLDLGPEPVVTFQMGQICTATSRLSEAADYHRMAYEADPDNPYIAREHATDLMRAGETQEGMRIMRTAVDNAPGNPQLHSHYLMRLSYLPDLDPQAILQEHLCWAQRHAPVHLARQDHPNVPDPGRRLRIGYLCSEFRDHATVYNFEPFLDGRDRDQFEVYGYGSVGFPDQVTERLKGKFDGYHEILRLDDRAAADLIAGDRIDVLVVIGGHVPDNRLRVLAYKPAPVQVGYGAVSTTGMSQIDYRLTDTLKDGPPSETLYAEQAVYVEPGGDCYLPPRETPSVGPLPALANGMVTFACFNNVLKITPAILALWASILKVCPNSRLLLKFKDGEVPFIRKALHDRLGALGIDPRRVEILGWVPDRLALCNQADIALDTYPYSGCTTTCECLWMGLPVISRVGEPRGYWYTRMGYAVLRRVGLEILAASSDRQYVVKAVALAQNLTALAKIRASLRARMTAPGGLGDAGAHMQGVERAYRWMWRQWCEGRHQKQQAGITMDEERTP